MNMVQIPLDLLHAIVSLLNEMPHKHVAGLLRQIETSVRETPPAEKEDL